MQQMIFNIPEKMEQFLNRIYEGIMICMTKNQKSGLITILGKMKTELLKLLVPLYQMEFL